MKLHFRSKFYLRKFILHKKLRLEISKGVHGGHTRKIPAKNSLLSEICQKGTHLLSSIFHFFLQFHWTEPIEKLWSTRPHFHAFLSQRYRSLSQAKQQCTRMSRCGGLVLTRTTTGRRGWMYELRYGHSIYKSPSHKITYLKRCRWINHWTFL